MHVYEVMVRPVVTVSEDTPVRVAAVTLAQRGFAALPVLDRDKPPSRAAHHRHRPTPHPTRPPRPAHPPHHHHTVPPTTTRVAIRATLNQNRVSRTRSALVRGIGQARLGRDPGGAGWPGIASLPGKYRRAPVSITERERDQVARRRARASMSGRAPMR